MKWQTSWFHFWQQIEICNFLLIPGYLFSVKWLHLPVNKLIWHDEHRKKYLKNIYQWIIYNVGRVNWIKLSSKIGSKSDNLWWVIFGRCNQGHWIYRRNKNSSQCLKDYGLGIVPHLFLPVTSKTASKTIGKKHILLTKPHPNPFNSVINVMG